MVTYRLKISTNKKLPLLHFELGNLLLIWLKKRLTNQGCEYKWNRINCTYLFSPSDNADNRLNLPLSSSSVSDNFKAWKIRTKNMIIVVLFQKIALRKEKGEAKGVVENKNIS